MISNTNVYLTIDLECKKNSPDYCGNIYGKLKGHNQSYGLDFILGSLKKFGLNATFFVEPFFSYKFGRRALIEVCDKILSHSHDIQLHMHPYFKFSKGELSKDYLYTYSYEDQVSLIQEGKQILSNCGVPKIIAFRAGSFAANNVTYKALVACDIKISSNYNLDFLNKTCKISIPRKFNDFFYYEDKILEIPITCFCEYNFLRLKKSFRHMQITAVSYPEMEYVIRNAGSFNLKNIVILFHTFEFVNFVDGSGNVGKINRTNIKRFLQLCEFLSNNREKIEVLKISDVTVNKKGAYTIKNDNIPRMPISLTIPGKFEQVKKKIYSITGALR